MYHDTAHVLDVEARQIIANLKSLCAEQKLTLYCDGTTLTGEFLLYRIKEKPTFRAKVRVPS